MKRLAWIITLLLFVVNDGVASALEPANPQANAKARAILNYLEKLPAAGR